jgi:CheY-like chemotaxis protein
VEDNDDFRKFVVLYLKRAGYRVLSASNSAEALSVLADTARKVDLLLIDIELLEAGALKPLGGLRLAEAARSTYRGLGVVFISGVPLAQEIEKAVHAQGALLFKPFDLPLLLRTVRRMIESRTEEKSSDQPA